MREAARAGFGLLLVLLLGLIAPLAMAAPRIGVMTMQPGEIFWERFGHNAIVVDDPARGGPVSYNFGFFDMGEPDFVARFVRGEMRYALVALPLEDDLSVYRQEGRGVAVQWLDLSPAQAQALAQALEENARPENAHYRYDYFRDNCATRVRDALDRALAGVLGPQLAAGSEGNTYRSEASRLSRPARWMWLGFQLGLGPNADKPLSHWEEAFIPMRLAESLRRAKTASGTPLVLAEEILLPHRLAAEPTSQPEPVLGWTLAGIALGIALLVLGRRRPRMAAAFALTFWLLCGLIGAVMLYLWFGSAHWAGWRNHSLLLMNPLAWLLLPGGWAVLRGRAPSTRFRRLLMVVSVIALLALPLSWLGIDAQDNGLWLGLCLPLHIALAWLWAGRHNQATILR